MSLTVIEYKFIGDLPAGKDLAVLATNLSGLQVNCIDETQDLYSLEFQVARNESIYISNRSLKSNSKPEIDTTYLCLEFGVLQDDTLLRAIKLSLEALGGECVEPRDDMVFKKDFPMTTLKFKGRRAINRFYILSYYGVLPLIVLFGAFRYFYKLICSSSDLS